MLQRKHIISESNLSDFIDENLEQMNFCSESVLADLSYTQLDLQGKVTIHEKEVEVEMSDNTVFTFNKLLGGLIVQFSNSPAAHRK